MYDLERIRQMARRLEQNQATLQKEYDETLLWLKYKFNNFISVKRASRCPVTQFRIPISKITSYSSQLAYAEFKRLLLTKKYKWTESYDPDYDYHTPEPDIILNFK